MTNKMHAKVGQKIKLLNTNNADWMREGETYLVESVEDYDPNDQGEVLYKFKGVSGSWWGHPRHFNILNSSGDEKLLEEAARRYPKGTYYLEVGTGSFGTKHMNPGIYPPTVYDMHEGKPRIMTHEGGGIVYMNEVWAPVVHESFQRFDKGDTVVRWRDIEYWEWEDIGEICCPPIGKELKIETVEAGRGLYKLPSIYFETHGWYPATAFIFSEYYNQSITNRGTAGLNTTDYGKDQDRIIEVQRSSASIITGERRTGSTIQGRGDAAIVRRRYPSYKTITGK